MKQYIFYLIFLFSNSFAVQNDLVHAIIVAPWVQYDQQVPENKVFSYVSFQNQQIELQQNFVSSLEIQKELVRQDFICRKLYQMSLLAYNNLMNKNIQDFLKTILDPKCCYSDDVLVTLATQYKQKFYKNKKKCQQVDDGIVAELSWRNSIRKVHFEQQEAKKKREQEQQLQRAEKLRQEDQKRVQALITTRFKNQQEKFKKDLQRFGLDPEQFICLPQDFELLHHEYEYVKQLNSFDDSEKSKARLQAAQKSLDQNLAQSDQSIELSAKSQAYLKYQGFDSLLYQNCYGTALQHQLHHEQCGLFEKIADLASKPQVYVTSFFEVALKSNDAAFWANKFESLLIAANLGDIAETGCFLADWIMSTSAKYRSAILEGGFESVKDFVHMVAHPLDTIKNLAQAAGFILETMALYSSDYDEEFFKSLRKQRGLVIENMVHQGKEAFLNASGPERAKMVSRLGFDCIVTHKATQALGAFIGVLRSQGPSLRTLEWAADVIEHEPEFAGVAEKIFELQEELEKSVVNSVGEISGIKLPVKSIVADVAETFAVRPIEHILEDVAKYGYKIPLNDIALCQEVRQFIKQILSEVNCIIDVEFKEKNLWKMICEEAITRKVNLDLEHVINYGIEISENYAEGILNLKFKGGHLAGSTEALEAQGLIKILEKRKLPNGCYEYIFEDVFYKIEQTKTEFPQHWDYKKIIESCWEVYENPLIPDYLGEDKVKYIREGITKDNFKMSLIIKHYIPKNNIKVPQYTSNVVTILPFTKKI